MSEDIDRDADDAAWLAPIDAAGPVGQDLSLTALFDTLAEMRRADDPTLDQGDWVHEPKCADDEGVMAACDEALRTRSKDLRLVGWWIEATTRLHGAAGLAHGLDRLAALIRKWPQAVHPADAERRAGALSWLLLRMPDWLHAMAPPMPEVACRLRTAFTALEAAMLEPGLLAGETLAGEVAGEVAGGMAARAAVLRVTDGAAAVSASAPAACLAAPVAAAPAAGPLIAEMPPFHPAPTDRDAVIRQLQAVADWFRSHEPHSPVGYLAARAASWATMPLHVWLRGVVRDAGSLAMLEELLDAPRDGR